MIQRVDMRRIVAFSHESDPAHPALIEQLPALGLGEHVEARAATWRQRLARGAGLAAAVA